LNDELLMDTMGNIQSINNGQMWSVDNSDLLVVSIRYIWSLEWGFEPSTIQNEAELRYKVRIVQNTPTGGNFGAAAW